MRLTALRGCFLCLLLVTTAPVWAWSVEQAVTVIDPNLGVEVVWEDHDAKTYCESFPPNLDRLACIITPDPAEFWIGVDALGNRYGMIVTDEPTGSYYDLIRRPVGTNFNNHIARVIKRVEEVFGQPTKILASGRWEIDLTNGWLLMHLRAECLTADCQAEGDTGEHLALLRITGLPSLVDLVNSFDPAGSVTFRVPRLPEGLPTGDRFDVYFGDVATLGDLSRAQPLACDVAAGRPIGREVVVADPLSPPAAGEGRYYLTAVTSGLEQRAGRTRRAGTLSGRDATGLPPCAVP